MTTDHTPKRVKPTVLERLGDLYDRAPIMLHSIDNKGRLVSVNACWRETLGYTTDELLGRHVSDFFTEESRQEINAVLPRFFLNGRVENMALRMLTKDGQVLDVQLSSVGEYDGQGRFVRSLAAIKDVTAERRVAEQARLHTETLETLLRLGRLREQSLPDIARYVLGQAQLLTGSEDGFVLARDHDAAVFRRLASDPHSAAVCGIYPPADLFELGKAGCWAEAIYRRRPFVLNDYAAPHPAKRGLPPGHRPLHRLLVVPVQDEAETELLLAVANKAEAYDDSDIRRVSLLGDGLLAHIKNRLREEDLERARAQAEAANQAKGGFLANMSHEIRTPLSGIIGLTQMTLSQAPKAQIRENLELILDSSRSLLGIVNDILDFSKIEAGKMEFLPVDFDLREVLDRTMKPFQFSSRQKGLGLSVRIAPAVPELLHGDPDRFMQVVRNLVSNALKFTDRGEVSVDIDLARPGDPMLVECSVRDTGIGIPPDRHAELFQLFTQLETSRSKRHGGTGLGLAISRRLVEMMGGSIRLESAPGEGSLFAFTVSMRPATEASRQCPSPEAPCPAGDLAGLRVVLAEDNQVNRLFLRHFLQEAGCEVRCAGTGAEVLDLLAASPAELVLMDIQMPEMDGMAATRRLREGAAGEGARHLPVVALTAYSMKGDRERFLAAGLDDYVSKPVDVEELFTVMRRVLRGADATTRVGGETPEPSIDMEYYDARGKAAFAREICRMFLDESQGVAEALDQALARGDWTAAGEVAHGLLGMAVPLRARHLTEVARRLQVAGLAKDPEACRLAGLEVLDALALVQTAIRAYLAG